jgi:methylenetetrahydrofolate--tRNA-(uracil-5-)-methyltransferase
MSAKKEITIIGGGLAGAEAAWQAAKRGSGVVIYEMRPVNQTPAHKTDRLAELVCSNSLGSNSLENAGGLLKEEMRRLDSLILKAADDNSVPAGSALAVDRDRFTEQITHALEEMENIRIVREEIKAIPDNGPVILATGPLTSDSLTDELIRFNGSDALYFFDAISPIVDTDSVNMDKAYKKSRYDKGGADYLNCPFTKEEYDAFYRELLNAEKFPVRDFEKKKFFEGCIPIEVLAGRGEKTLTFGPMKPVGLIDPRTGKRPYAVVQLRMENKSGTMYNLVGFQTSLKRGEQKRVFRMIPGLENAEFLRYGSLHRNTFINAPRLLKPTLQTKKRDDLFFAGQITGVEGYLESTASGLMAGINAHRLLTGNGAGLVYPPETTAQGALLDYITSTDPEKFQPMNINFGLFPPLKIPVRDKKVRKQMIVQRALTDLKSWIDGQL